ncbi:hypothetical protein GCK72_003804 [Caenorhabditis remanei]|uniref:PCI domain-containing protein n=1 Tax=Caenorhabditis remanei TaxID=31234 RepID=A0A6A5HAI1_CAERE|nr:hypothetical protein GCK72_003802 [Caenorhabditis remanei]XP_053588450.1 hypothetical protein GCK72_003804 [Caenorhabditis remanei]KAF1763856.1 hypothetical protein GCK72_003802 [Caenorhabditis remanei]KAF1763858.1 hypothetical protein GCK72_003804 [Caenorhabditis remanei]
MADKREPIKVDPVDVGDTTELDNLAHLAAHGGDGRLFKMEQDYTKQVDEALLKARDLAQKDVVAAVESLNNIEKLTRLGADMKSNTRVVQYMAKLCFEGQKWDLLMETIMTLSKKRLLIKMAIAKMVRDAVAMIEKMPTEELKMKLIETLRTVTAGKIYVEVERARLTSMVVKKLEAEGKLDEAATMLLELQVETYGSMEMKEKVLYLLEQMRYSLVRNDYVRATIISKKINIKFFNKSDAEDVQDLKLKYYELMIRIGLHDGNYLDVCRHHREIYETKKIKEDSVKATSHLRSAVVYCLLAPHTNEQWDLLNRIAIQRELETVPDYKIILDLFINQELISFKGTIVAKYEKLLRRGTTASPDTGIFDKSTEGEKRWSDLHLRVGEHNMRMIAKYYTQITFERLAELLDFPVDEMESFVCNLIVSGHITGAKLHRPSRIVYLRLKKANVEQLDVWASNVQKLTDTLNKVSHLILKEQMVHKNLELAVTPRA